MEGYLLILLCTVLLPTAQTATISKLSEQDVLSVLEDEIRALEERKSNENFDLSSSEKSANVIEDRGAEGIPRPPEHEESPKDRRSEGIPIPQPPEHEEPPKDRRSEGIPIPQKPDGNGDKVELKESQLNLDERTLLKDMEKDERNVEASKLVEKFVESTGNNCDELSLDKRLGDIYGSPRMNRLRDGQASDTDSCDHVREVPAELRDARNMFMPISSHYQLYTETYGIPIIGSKDVHPIALTRACYVIRYLLAHRYDIRNCYYKLYGRVGLIGDKEQQTSLTEYRDWDADFWNTRVRGLGPSISIPLTSAGDDNMRCAENDRYWDQDIMIHEFAHGIHLMAAVYAIEGFQIRLKQCYNDAKHPSRNNPNLGTYAMSSFIEYWAVMSQLYFEVFKSGEYKNSEGDVLDTREKLCAFDPCICELMKEVFPCPNLFIDRCEWKNCKADDFHHALDKSFSYRSGCKEIVTSYIGRDVDSCAKFACHNEGNVFNYAPKICRVLWCDKLNTVEALNDEKNWPDNANYIRMSKPKFDIYIAKRFVKLDAHREVQEKLLQECNKNKVTVKVKPNRSRAKRCDVDEKIQCGRPETSNTKASCERKGCCFDTENNQCYYPVQDAADKSIYCPDLATKVLESGKTLCQENPIWMMFNCPNSCQFCEFAYRVIVKFKADAEKMCQDPWCENVPQSYCTSSSYKKFCRKKCGTCVLPADWQNTLDVEDLQLE